MRADMGDSVLVSVRYLEHGKTLYNMLVDKYGDDVVFVNSSVSTNRLNEVLKDLSELSGGNDIALVCYEKPGDNCHRHLIADWLPCEVIEYNPQNLISV